MHYTKSFEMNVAFVMRPYSLPKQEMFAFVMLQGTVFHFSGYFGTFVGCSVSYSLKKN